MTSVSSEHHRRAGAERGPVDVAVVTVSDTRTAETDVNGAFLRDAVASDGHRFASYRLIPDEPSAVAAALEDAAADAQAIVFNGGTGISRRDTTFDVITGMLERPLPGFGELFRMLSYAEVGAAAMLSRATAGTYQGRIVFSVPGSPAAVRLAWSQLIAPELHHLVWEAGR